MASNTKLPLFCKTIFSPFTFFSVLTRAVHTILAPLSYMTRCVWRKLSLWTYKPWTSIKLIWLDQIEFPSQIRYIPFSRILSSYLPLLDFKLSLLVISWFIRHVSPAHNPRQNHRQNCQGSFWVVGFHFSSKINVSYHLKHTRWCECQRV